MKTSYEIHVKMELDSGDYKFELNWEGPNTTYEVECIQKPTTLITETQLKELVSAFREAKAKFNDEIENMTKLLNPFIESLSGEDE